MKALKFLVFAMLVLGMAAACSNDKLPEQEIEEEDWGLTSWWINNQQDTLRFIGDGFLEYKPRIPTNVPFLYFYKIEGDTIAFQSIYSSDSEAWTRHYFKYSNKQIEIRGFQGRERDLYERIKEEDLILDGRWINNRQDTLLLVVDIALEYKPHIPTSTHFFYSYQITGDSITLQSVYSSDSESWTRHYFKYSSEQVEIRDFQGRERDLYGRIKE